MSKERKIDDSELDKVTGAGDEHLKNADYVPGVPVGSRSNRTPPPAGGGGGGGAPDGVDGDADTGGDQDVGSA